MQKKTKAPLNRSITLTEEEFQKHKQESVVLKSKPAKSGITNKIINQDLFEAVEFLPGNFVDLLIIDPPYNLYKKFNRTDFKEMEEKLYEEWIDSWMQKLLPTLKVNASIYVCCDWKSSNAFYNILKKYFIVRNRITWEREKGRGAKKNWKNCSEDIWFCTMSKEYKFNLENVKLRRKVLAPYKNENGQPKDWENTNGGNFRDTFPSNIWTDITIPFWSMPENTEHPTQKPEKLIAKMVLASSDEKDFVFDPFCGSGTTCIVAKKLNRNFLGIEMDELYSALALKRLKIADKDKSIQGYDGKVFWERNSFTDIKNKK